MTKTLAETLLFSSVAINAALLIFFAGVYRKMINSVDEATFKRLTTLLVHYSSKSPFMIIIMNVPLIGAIPYYYFYGFGNRWFTIGLAMWLIAGSISKMIKVPVYKSISKIGSDDAAQLNNLRHTLNKGNVLQAVLYTIAVLLMAPGLYYIG